MRLFTVLLLTILVSGCREAKQEPASTSHDNKTAHQEKPLFDWIAQAKGDDPALRQKAIFTITELLKNENQQIRGQGEFALRSIGPAAVPALMELRYDKDWQIRDTAARLLGTIGPGGKTAIPALSELAKDENERVRRQAALALASIGPASVPALTELLNDKDWHVRSEVAWALGTVGPEAKPAIPALAKLLKDNSGAAATCDQVRGAAAWGLGGIGPQAKMAIPSLTDLLQDKNGAVRLAAAWRWARLGPRRSRPFLPSRNYSKTRILRFDGPLPSPWGRLGPRRRRPFPLSKNYSRTRMRRFGGQLARHWTTSRKKRNRGAVAMNRTRVVGKSGLVAYLLAAVLCAAAWESAFGQEAQKKPPPHKLRVVVVGAHCDDPESGAGGLIVSLTRAGHEVIVAYTVCFRDDRKCFGQPEAQVRQKEAEAACKIMGATAKFFPYACEKLGGRRGHGESGFFVVGPGPAGYRGDPLAAGHPSQSPRHQFHRVAMLPSAGRLESLFLRGRDRAAKPRLPSRVVSRHWCSSGDERTGVFLPQESGPDRFLANSRPDAPRSWS